MAIMLPTNPREFVPSSREGIMFYALSELPEDWYVLHSFQMSKVDHYGVHDYEADFVVFHPQRGLLCIEAKATRAQYVNGEWCYADGMPMSGGGPFAQAKRNMYSIRDLMIEHGLENIVNNCKMHHAVWFPLVSKEYIQTLNLPAEAVPELILTEEALSDPLPYLERIFSLAERGKTKTTISERMATRLVNEILCPQFDIAPSLTFDIDTKRMVFHRLLREQAGILNFLVEQKTAAINGAAGTGKTLIAVEKARRHASIGEKVLFLCFNNLLKNHLADQFPHSLIEYFTISGFACHLCHTAEPDYNMLNEILEEMWEDESFPYQHVIIDEGQDFGIEAIESASILDTLKAIIEDTKENGSLYVFYDKLQLIQARKLPEFLESTDCKLTLYRNCRNTESIAKTSLRPISDRNPKLMDNYVVGVPAKLQYCSTAEEVIRAVDGALDALLGDGINDTIILTSKKETDSVLAHHAENGFYRSGSRKIRFSTCRKYKGLEADAVILVDLDENTFLGSDGQGLLLYYVGASRARLHLHMIASLEDDACTRVLQKLGRADRIRNPKRDLAKALYAHPIIDY